MTLTPDYDSDNPAYDDFVGPCGCDTCDKWTDCDYCSECNAYSADAEAHRREQQERAEQEERESLAFWEWLDGR